MWSSKSVIKNVILYGINSLLIGYIKENVLFDQIYFMLSYVNCVLVLMFI